MTHILVSDKLGAWIYCQLDFKQHIYCEDDIIGDIGAVPWERGALCDPVSLSGRDGCQQDL